jgi:protein-disulfide isomerase
MFLSPLRSLLAAAFLITCAPAIAQSQLPRAEIEGIVKDYLLKNPEVLRDALIELERRGKAEEDAQRARAVSDLAPKIFNSPRQVVVGNPAGKIELVEFFDYNCGYCKKAFDDLTQLIRKNPDLRVVLKEFPVLGPGSIEATQVAHSVRMQGPSDKYWAFHQKLLTTRGQIGKAQALAAARDAGLDIGRLTKDIDSDEVKASLQEVMQIADALGLTGTPSYVVGSDVVVGAVGASDLQGRIDNLRRCGKTTCS